MASETAQAVKVRLVLDAAAEVGISDRFLCDAVGLAPEVLESQGRIDKRQLRALWHAASHLSGDPCFGLHAGERLRASTFGVIGFAIRSCSNLAEAIELGLQYMPHFFQDTVAELKTEGPVARLRYRYSDHAVTSPHACDYMMATLITAGRKLTGVDWVPRHVSLQREHPGDLREHTRLFRSLIVFGSEWNVLAFDPSILELPLVDPDPELRELLGPYVDDFVRQTTQAPQVTTQVREILARSLREGDPSLAATARALGLTSRSLNRQLRDEGSSFREVLESVRVTLARRYLLERSLSEEDVSALLGFSDPEAFRREFENWRGVSGRLEGTGD